MKMVRKQTLEGRIKRKKKKVRHVLSHVRVVPQNRVVPQKRVPSTYLRESMMESNRQCLHVTMDDDDNKLAARVERGNGANRIRVMCSTSADISKQQPNQTPQSLRPAAKGTDVPNERGSGFF